MTRASEADAGCWIDGHWGQYGVARMIQIASEYGYVDTAATPPFATLDCVAIALKHLEFGSDVDWQELENMEQASDDVETWLNENVAPEGFYFEWFDGEFFLSAVEPDDADPSVEWEIEASADVQ